MDIEIEYNDKEQKIRDEMEELRVNSEQQQKELLKDRQAKEKLMMFNELMKGHDDSDAIKHYLEKQKRDTEKDLDKYKKQIE